MYTPITFVQLNLNRCRAANTSLTQFITEHNVDIALLQEPYTIRNTIPHMKPHWRVVHCTLSPIKSAIIVYNPAIDFTVHTASTNHVVITIPWNNQNLTVGSIYAPPGDSLVPATNAITQIVKVINNEYSLVCGDFNAHNSVWGSRLTNKRGRALLEAILVEDLHLANNPDFGPTFSHNGESFIDLTIISGSLLPYFNGWKIDDTPNASDHNSIIFHVTSPLPPTPLKRYRTKYGNWTKLNKAIKNNLPCTPLTTVNSASLNTLTNELQFTIISACDKVLGFVQPRKHRANPWWTPVLSATRNKIRALRRRSQTLKHDPSNGVHLLYRRENAVYKRAIEIARHTSWKDACTKVTLRDPFTVPYKLTTNKLNKPLILRDLMLPGGKRTTTHIDAIQLLMDYHFRKDSTLTDTAHHQELRRQMPLFPTTSPDKPFTKGEIEDVVRALPVGKAPGNDLLTAEILKHIFDTISGTLTYLLNECFRVGFFPDAWKVARVIFIPKPNKESTEPANYRALCVLLILGKVFEMLINARLYYHLHITENLHPSQYGFRNGTSTTHALSLLIQQLKQNRHDGYYTSVISIDIKGAFDHLWWPKIFDRLKTSSCPANIYALLLSYFENRLAKFSSNTTSCTKQLELGAPQGSAISPTLWNLVFDELFLVKLHSNSNSQAFADDALTVTKAASRSALVDATNYTLNQLHTWCHQNKLTIAANKTLALTIAPGTQPSTMSSYMINGEIIQSVREFSYLGVILNDKLTWTSHLHNVRKKITKITMQLSTIARLTWGLQGEVLRSLYNTVIERILLYAVPAWWTESHHKTLARQLLSIQRIPLLKITKSYKTTSTDALQAITRLIPVDIRASQETAWHRLTKFHCSYTHEDQIFHATDYQRDVNIWEIHPADRISLPFDNKKPRYSTSNETTIFTDGSKTAIGSACAFCVFQNGGEIYSHQEILLNGAGIYQCEARALQNAISWVTTNHHTMDTHIYTDSLSCLFAIANRRDTNPSIMHIKQGIIDFTKAKIFLHWIKAHDGDLGNERADHLANIAANTPVHIETTITKSSLPPPLRHLKTELYTRSYDSWKSRWTSSTNALPLKRFLSFPNKLDKIPSFYACQLLTGHGKLPAYFYRFRLSNDTSCQCGAPIGDNIHYLVACPYTEHLIPKQYVNRATQFYNFPKFFTVPGFQVLHRVMKYIFLHYEAKFRPKHVKSRRKT